MFMLALPTPLIGPKRRSVVLNVNPIAWMRAAGIGAVLAGQVCFASHKDSWLDWGPYPPVAPWTQGKLPHQWAIVPMYFPLVGDCHYHNDYDVNRGSYKHTGIDIVAPQMTPIVAPFDGKLGMKKESFWIYGDNGWALLGTHLNDEVPGSHAKDASRDVMFAPNVRPGQHVHGGQFIGYVGMSGNATGPHLHFELYAPGKGPSMNRLRDPWPSLKRAQHIRRVRIWIPQKTEIPPAGVIRLQGCVRKVDQSVGKITIILLAKQTPDGHVTPVSHLRYIRLKLSDTAVLDAGGWDALNGMNETNSLGFYVPYARVLDGRTVDHILVTPPANQPGA